MSFELSVLELITNSVRVDIWLYRLFNIKLKMQFSAMIIYVKLPSKSTCVSCIVSLRKLTLGIPCIILMRELESRYNENLPFKSGPMCRLFWRTLFIANLVFSSGNQIVQWYRHNIEWSLGQYFSYKMLVQTVNGTKIRPCIYFNVFWFWPVIHYDRVYVVWMALVCVTLNLQQTTLYGTRTYVLPCKYM